MAITPAQVQKSVQSNTPTKANVSGVRPQNFIDKKSAFTAYSKAKESDYAGDFVQFISNLENKGYAIEEAPQIKQAKAKQQFLEQKKKDAQIKALRKIPLSEATGTDIRNDFTKTLGEDFDIFGAPVAGALQGLSDIGQGAVGKPVEFLAKKFMGMFGYDDESLDSLTTQSDISKGFNEQGAKLGREVGKFAGSVALTPGGSLGTLKGLKGLKYMQEIGKRLAIGAGEGLVGNLAYNVATTDTAGTPVNLGVGTAIGAGFRALPIIGNGLTPLLSKIPGIKNNLANKLELSGIMNRTKLEKLQEILRQGGAEELAQGTPDDVAEWMFQRGLEGNKQTIMSKLDEIAEASMDMLDRKLSKVEGLHDTGTLDDILAKLSQIYEDATSGVFKGRKKEVMGMIAKKQKEGGLTLKEINRVKQLVYSDLNPYTVSGKVKEGLNSQDIAFANGELKRFIEEVAERAGVTTDKMTVKLLNNEFAMADAMKKAIAQKDALDATSTIVSFISHSGGPLAIGGTLGATTGPFDKNTTAGIIGNVVLGALLGKVASSTTIKTKVANWIRNMPKAEQAGILNVIKKGSEGVTEADKNVLLQSLQKLDVDMIDNANLNFSDEVADISRAGSIGDTATDVTNVADNVAPMATETVEQAVTTPTASLDEMLLQATDEELKSKGFTATMIKKIRKQQNFTDE